MFSCCVHTQAAARLFSHLAKLYVWRYRLFGLARSQLKLIAGLERIGYRAASLLEIGCGVGWLHQWLLKHGAARAVGVDLSPEMVAEARRLALKQGLAAQTSYLIGDFIALAESIEPVEIVLLDKVICCYPDANVLLIQAASRARRAVALTQCAASPAVQGGEGERRRSRSCLVQPRCGNMAVRRAGHDRRFDRDAGRLAARVSPDGLWIEPHWRSEAGTHRDDCAWSNPRVAW